MNWEDVVECPGPLRNLEQIARSLERIAEALERIAEYTDNHAPHFR